MKKTLLFCALVISNVLNGERLPKHIIATLLPEDAIMLDAGAYEGNDTIEWSRLLPKATIYAVEPVPAIFKRLQNTTQNCSNVMCVEKALSNQSGYQEMYIGNGNERYKDQSSSLLLPTLHCYYFPHITFTEKILVETITLDKLAEDMHIDHIDFLWLDLQGMEQAVLQASPNIMKTVNVIFTEVSYCELYKGTPLYPEFKAWMESQGFIALSEIPEHKTFGDTLFVRKDYLMKRMNSTK